MSNGRPSTPAGWYPAPHANNEQRYWDGERWLNWTPEQAAAANAPAATAVATEAPPRLKKRVRWWMWLLIALGALILISIIGTALGTAGRVNNADPAPTQSQSAEADQTEAPATPEPVETEEPTLPPPPPPAPAVPQQVFSGAGDSVLDVNIADAAIVTFTCDVCENNTIVETNGAESLLVNTIGSYRGSKLININDNSLVTRFTIQAGGSWTLIVDDLTTAPATAGAANGTGDAVVLMTGSFDVAEITNDGERNFIVLAYGEGNFSPLIVNEIGAYSGTVEMTGPAVVEVSSTGNWSITPR